MPSLEAVGGVELGPCLTSDEDKEASVVATLVADEEDREAEELALNRKVEVASDAGSMEDAYQDYLQRQAEDAHLERMRENPSPVYDLDLSRCPTPNYKLFRDLFLL